MTLAETIGTKTKNTSSKGPQFYNAEKAQFIVDMISDPNVDVRIAACANVHVPAKLIAARLRDEDDSEVLKAILMNPNLPKKALIQFVKTDHRAKQFEEDEDLIAFAQSLNLEE